MRIGVCVPTSAAESGGGWTIENDLFKSLLEIVPESDHSFVFLGTTAHPSFSLPENTSYLNVNPVRPLFARGVNRAGRIAKKSLYAINDFLEFSARPTKERPSILQQEQIQFLLSLVPGVLSMEIPYLCFVWDLEFLIQPYFPELSQDNEWKKRFEHYQTLLRRATYIVTGTTVSRNQIIKFFQFPEERILLRPHPTPADAVQYADSQSSTASKTAGISFLYPAQFWPHKNHVTLLKAFKLYLEKYNRNARLVLCGSDRGNRAYVESYARKLDVVGQMEFRGFISRSELLQLYTQADALVYPSTFGPDNLPPLEAFALRCPVVASRILGAEEQLGDAAILIDPYDAEMFADAMHRVTSDSRLRADLIQKGQERARKQTAFDVIRSILLEIDRFERTRELWP